MEDDIQESQKYELSVAYFLKACWFPEDVVGRVFPLSTRRDVNAFHWKLTSTDSHSVTGLLMEILKEKVEFMNIREKRKTNVVRFPQLRQVFECFFDPILALQIYPKTLFSPGKDVPVRLIMCDESRALYVEDLGVIIGFLHKVASQLGLSTTKEKLMTHIASWMENRRFEYREAMFDDYEMNVSTERKKALSDGELPRLEWEKNVWFAWNYFKEKRPTQNIWRRNFD